MHDFFLKGSSIDKNYLAWARSSAHRKIMGTHHPVRVYDLLHNISVSLSRPVLPDRELTKGGSVTTSGCQQRARVMKLRYVAWWWRSRE